VKVTSRESTLPNAAPGTGIDRSTIRRLLQLSPEERIRLLVEEVRNLEEFDRLAKRR
jgi:hypothetical protein